MKRVVSSDRGTRDRGIGFTFGVSVGVISAWIIYGVYDSWPIFGDARWWEVFTAIGTVGAVVTALFFGLSDSVEKLKKTEKQKKIYMRLFQPELSVAYSATGIIRERLESEFALKGVSYTDFSPLSSSSHLISALSFGSINLHIKELYVFDIPCIEKFASLASRGPFMRDWLTGLEKNMEGFFSDEKSQKNLLEMNKEIRECIEFIFTEVYGAQLLET